MNAPTSTNTPVGLLISDYDIFCISLNLSALLSADHAKPQNARRKTKRTIDHATRQRHRRKTGQPPVGIHKLLLTMGPRRPHSGDRNTSRDVAPPPTQVFTRGRTGVVKTRPQMEQQQVRRSTSMDPSNRRSRTKSKSKKAPRYPSKRSSQSHVSVEIMSYADSLDISEDQSIHSAPSPVPRRKRDHLERREPSTSSRTSPSVSKQQQFNKRDLSPDRSIDIQKQHVRTTRKIVEGTSKPGKIALFQ